MCGISVSVLHKAAKVYMCKRLNAACKTTSAHLSICLSRTDAHACVCILRTRHMNEQATGNDLLPRFTNETSLSGSLFCYVNCFIFFFFNA